MHGGKRENAGRKPAEQTKQILSVRIESELIKQLPTGTDKAKFVEVAIHEHLQRING
jgi:hypothetical protein